MLAKGTSISAHQKFMKISINDKPYTLLNSKSIQCICDDLNFESTGIAIAVNNEVIPRKKWDDYELSDGDKVLVITATAGG